MPRGASARAKANIDAIRLVKRLEQEGRPATPEEKKILTQFTGWGSLAQTVFNPDFVVYARMEGRGGGLPPYLNADAVAKYRKWKSQYGEVLHPDLGGLLTEKEWAAAEKSTLNAHYTDRKVISAMWEMAEKLGFRGGRVLEPSAGTGLFFGLMPEGVARNSALVGVELDELTGKILKHLYPDADIQISGFEKAKRLGDNTVDLVISNVPFGDFTVFDKTRPQYNKQSIHNYFFSRALDTVRPGGLVMQITSHFTLDSGSAAKLREEWSRKADLVAAVRLPGTAFEKNAVLREAIEDVTGAGAQATGLKAAAEWTRLQEDVARCGSYAPPEDMHQTTAHVVRVMGGWRAVCAWETRYLDLKRREFVDLWTQADGKADVLAMGAAGVQRAIAQTHGGFVRVGMVLPGLMALGESKKQIGA